MVCKTYVEAKTFEGVRKNQDTLISVLNHSMTKIKTDVCWLKKIQGWEVAILTAILTAIIAIAIKI